MGVFSPTQTRVYTDRYQHGIETIPEMWDRVAKWVASNDKPYLTKFRTLLQDFKFIPGGRINYAAGRSNVTAHNCFVLPSPYDSRGGIIDALRNWIETMARGGGVGINMSSLRPRGTPVLGTDGTSSGPIPWMELFTTASSKVVQQGGTRRGAAMIILNVDHPDIWEFIEAKQQAGVLEGANLSVGISDEFLEAVKKDLPWYLWWDKNPVKTVGARLLWKHIADSAWRCGEPGVVFLGRCNAQSNLSYLGGTDDAKPIICVNPCSEIPLPANGSCLLGTFNLAAYASIAEQPYFSWARLEEDITTAVRFLDNIIDLSLYPLVEYKEHQQSVRQMGIGVTGLADALITLGHRYGSDNSIAFVSRVFRTIRDRAYKTSIELAKERGSFSLYSREFLGGQFIKALPRDIQEGINRHGIRNSYLIAQQPSGTGSLLAGVNSGIEPVFSFNTKREDRTGIWNPVTTASATYDKAGRGRDDPTGPFVTAHELTPFEHINMQAAAQQYCDQAISKTVNCPEDWTVEQVESVLDYAVEKGLKSIAIYRNNSRSKQVLTHVDTPAIEDPNCRSGTCDV